MLADKNLLDRFYDAFVVDNRWRYIVDGLGTTLTIAFFALFIGLFLGFLAAFVRVTHHNTGRLRFWNVLVKIYLSVFRGTPVVIQLMIMYFVVFSAPGVHKVVVAIIAFGINSGAYVAEVFRSGIMSIDQGQMEAGRSLGLSYGQTMWRVIMPQAIKNILPALANEFIALFKETSVAGYVAVQDLTKSGDIIRSRTFDALPPLLVVAVLYFLMVKLLEFAVGRLEKKLRKGDRSGKGKTVPPARSRWLGGKGGVI